MSERYIGGLVYNPPNGWSGYFDGVGDYLSVAGASGNALGSGNFTIQFWFYLTGTTGIGSSGEIGMVGCGVTTASRYTVRIQGTSTRVMSWWLNTPSNNVTGTTPIALNTWYHTALVRSGSGSNNVKLYLNGVLESQGTSTYNSPADTILIGRTYTNLDGEYTNGYLSNVQIVVGTALYTANFTPPTAALLPITNTALLTCRYPTFIDGSTNSYTITTNGSTVVSTTNPFPTSVLPNPALGNAGNGIYTLSQYTSLLGAGTWPAIDPYYKNTVLNLHGNAGTTLPFNTDASTNNFQVTQVGDTRPSNYTPFQGNGYYSNYFSSVSDYLGVSTITLGSSYTIEFFVNFPTAPSSNNIILGNPASGGGTYWIGITSSTLSFSYTGTTRTFSFTAAAATWYYVQIIVTGSTVSAYVNGAQIGTTQTGPTTFLIDRIAGYAGNGLAGYLSNLRITNAANAVSTTPTSPLTAITNCVLLTCQSNRFVDNSASPYTLTPAGSVSVNPLQPFATPSGISAYGSGYFDGSGDYLNSPNNNFASSNFTIEGWFYPTTIANLTNFWGMDNGSGSTPKMIMYIDSSGNLTVDMGNAGTTQFPVSASASTYLRANAWNHVAVVRSGTGAGQFALYINGTSVSTGQLGTNISSITATFNIGYIGESYGQMFSGYVSNFRIVNGTAVYTGNFTPSTAPLTAVTNTSLLTVQTNAPSQNNTFLDSSTNNFVITRNGNTTQGTFTPYTSTGYWSNYFNGTSSWSLASASSTAFAFGSGGAWTFEAWVFPTASMSDNWVMQTADAGNMRLRIFTGGVLGWYSDTYGGGLNSSVAVPVNSWSHVAATYDGTTLRLFQGGVLTASLSSSSITNGTTAVSAYIGNYSGGSRAFQGYISNARIVKGSAVYTAAFTPSTGPLTAISGTSLLTCQSNRFADTSSNAFAITVNGSPSVQRFSAFSPTSYYSTSVIGGSCYFDGSGDSMTVGTAANCASGGAFAMGANFTVEFWFYPLSTSEQTLIENFTGTGGPGWTIYRKAGGQIEVYNGTSAFSGSVVLTTGQWYHIAFVRTSSTSAKTYINGVADMSTSSFGSGEYYQSTYPLYVGQRNPGDGRNFYTYGYFADVRVTKSAVYSGNFTPPTAPISPVANTSAMLNYTNAAIYDNAMMVDLETVGNAQLSTSVKKYGSASMYFDGSGDYLISRPLQIFAFGTGDFTMEAWVYLNSYNGTWGSQLAGCHTFAVGADWLWSINTTGKLYFQITSGGGSGVLTSTTSVPLSTWTYVTVVRSSGYMTFYINGINAGGSGTYATSMASTTNFSIGADLTGNAGSMLNGYIDDMRLSNVARYTGNFTPPTSQLQDQ